ncbi:hypothetical protein [Catenulispora rubra]|uniref:hypothetical protein n=1 Tax=Catenulispora rubra TaxID=280293 RepID=UPI001891F5EB|nr:hypothetical protein [Catenulispora rubra]
MTADADVDPERVFALIVSVEKHRDSSWDVSGPYADACAFATWLVDVCHVPVGNVISLASPQPGSLHDSSGMPLLPDGIITRSADSAMVSELFMDELAQIKADLLWVFWSGHGLTNPEGSRVLVLADSTTSVTRVIEVEGLQRALQSQRVGGNNGTDVVRVAIAVTSVEPASPELLPLSTERRKHIADLVRGPHASTRHCTQCGSADDRRRADASPR